MKTLAGLLLVLSMAPSAAAITLRALNPLDGATTVNLRVIIGGPATAEGGSRLELFQGDGGRADGAVRRIVATLTERFKKDGISSDPKGRDITIGIYGRSFQGDCGAQAVYTVGLYLWGDSEVPEDGEFNPSWDRGWIGVAADKELEDRIVSELLGVFEEILRGRSPERDVPR